MLAQALLAVVSALLFSAATLVSSAVALPAPGSTWDAQVVFGKDGRRYERGELPPVEDTVGWVDPRLNGGRLIDVRTFFFSFSSHSCRFSPPL